MVLDQLDIHMEKNNLDIDLTQKLIQMDYRSNYKIPNCKLSKITEEKI